MCRLLAGLLTMLSGRFGTNIHQYRNWENTDRGQQLQNHPHALLKKFTINSVELMWARGGRIATEHNTWITILKALLGSSGASPFVPSSNNPAHGCVASTTRVDRAPVSNARPVYMFRSAKLKMGPLYYCKKIKIAKMYLEFIMLLT